MPSPSTYSDDTEKDSSGVLYIVATPIGNMDDITLRALNVLKSVDLVAAEDTRHTGKLLQHFSIKKPLFAFHDHNERERMDTLIARLKGGESVALVSDAGTPSVSDPGFRLVREAVGQGLTVVPIPGVSAAVTALCASGLPTDAFTFLGFAPRKQGKRREWLTRVKQDFPTVIVYESPHRLVSLIDDMIHVFGDREAALGRELTKLHEEFVRGPLTRIRDSLVQREQIRGECTLVVAGAGETSVNDDDLDRLIRERLADESVSPSSLAKELATIYPVKKRDLYDRILRIRDAIEP